MITLRRNPRSYYNYGPLTASLILLIALVGFISLLSARHQELFLAEGGVFETLTVVGYAGSILLSFLAWSWTKIRCRWYFGAIITLFAMRELDLDKSQFSVGLFKSRQYVGDLVSLPERIISLLFIVLIMIVIISILINETKLFFSGILSLRPSEIAALVSLVLILLTKSVDGFGRKLAEFNISISKNLQNFSYIFEEIGEMGIPIMFAVAIVTSRSRSIDEHYS